MIRYNCCSYNHPCPLYCPGLIGSSVTEVVNPVTTAEYGYFNNVAGGTIATDAIIPVSLVQGSGTSITASPTTAGAVRLSAGNYEVSYVVEGTVPASGTLSTNLRLNGTDVPGSTLSTTRTVGNVVNQTQRIVLTVPQASTLELVNNSTDETTYSYANLVIRKI